MAVEDISGPANSKADQATAPDSAGQLGASRVKETFRSRVRKELQSHPARTEAEMAMDYRALGAVIGGIAVSLVLVVYIGNWVLFTHHVGTCWSPMNPRLPDSLSGYYYTHMRGVFVGAMCAMGVFFVAYRGYDRWDSRLTNVAGVAAICIGLFPTNLPSYRPNPNSPNLFFSRANECGPVTPITYHSSASQQLFSRVHAFSLIVLFVMVFLMVLVQFTRSSDEVPEDAAGRLWTWWKSLFSQGIRTWWRRIVTWAKSLFPSDPRKRKKKRRNKIYVGCACGIAICGLLAVANNFWASFAKLAPWLFFAEIGAFLCFGIAWYVKGAAAIPPEHRQLLAWTLSRPAGWLADGPRDHLDSQPAGKPGAGDS